MNFRLRIFLLHLFASMVLALLSIALVFGLWYPSPLHNAVGVTVVFIILLSVDVVIGPLLTLIVCKKNKKSLKFDLGVIVFLQLVAFSYGFYAVAQGRPVWIVFNIDRFDLVQAYQVNNEYRQKALSEYQELTLSGPKVVAARKPVDLESQNTLIFESMFAGVDIPVRPDLYIPYTEERANVKATARSLAELKSYNGIDRVNKVLVEWPLADAYLPMMSRAKPMTVLLKKETAEIIAIVDLNPWQ